jgi:hypothetical protein
VEIGCSMAATRAFEAFGPPHPKQLLLTGLFGTELFLKLQQTERFLLHKVTPICYLI